MLTIFYHYFSLFDYTTTPTTRGMLYFNTGTKFKTLNCEVCCPHANHLFFSLTLPHQIVPKLHHCYAFLAGRAEYKSGECSSTIHVKCTNNCIYTKHHTSIKRQHKKLSPPHFFLLTTDSKEGSILIV